MTYVYNCFPVENKYKCIQVAEQKAKSLLNNGIAYDKDSKIIYLSNLIKREIKIFKHNEDNSLTYLNKIYTNFAGDNIHFQKDKEGNIILTIGVLGSIKDHMILIEKSKALGKITQEKNLMFGGIKIKIPKNSDLTNNEIIKQIEDKIEIIVMQDEFKGVSSCFDFNGKFYLTSWGDDGILVCTN